MTGGDFVWGVGHVPAPRSSSPEALARREAEHLDALVDYAKATIVDTIRSRPRGGTIVWEGGEPVRLFFPDISPHPFTIRQAVEAGHI